MKYISTLSQISLVIRERQTALGTSLTAVTRPKSEFRPGKCLDWMMSLVEQLGGGSQCPLRLQMIQRHECAGAKFKY